MMRKPNYLSPTSLNMFYDNRDDFYINYLAENRPPRMPQTQPMAVGSAFDAYTKSFLVERIYGKAAKAEFDFDTIFENQVEPHNRAQALIDGKTVFDAYMESGSLAKLLIELESAQGDPRFEFTVQADVSCERELGTVPFLGKPDLFFTDKNGNQIISDWKVNGFYSKSGVSPTPGYVVCLDGWRDAPNSRSHRKEHKDAMVMVHNGLAINCANHFEHYQEDNAAQLCIYAWVLGQTVGSQFIIAIDQLACKDGKIRVAQHRGFPSSDYQIKLFRSAIFAWDQIQKENVFTDMPNIPNPSAHMNMLEMRYKTYQINDPFDVWFNENIG